MKLKPHLPYYIDLVDTHLGRYNLNRESILTGQDAWTVAHRAGVVGHAYDLSRDVYDDHIQTVLEKVFPNAIFNP